MAEQSSMPIWITESDVTSMMDLGGAIDALEAGLLQEFHGDAQNMVKTHVTWGNGHTLHAIGAAFMKTGFVGTKTWAHTKGGAAPMLILFDSENGSLRAIIEAFALGQMRTGAACGVATRFLASPNADRLAIVGTGKQALAQVAAIVAVRPIRYIHVFGRDSKKCAPFAELVRQQFKVEVVEYQTVKDALHSVPIVTVVTRAQEPIISADMLSRGSHINAVGAIVPERAEIAQDVFMRCTCVTADSVPQAQKLSREMIEFFRESTFATWDSVWPLSRIVGLRRIRNADDDLTMFKALGMGVSDLSLGINLYQKAMRLGLGRKLEAPSTAMPHINAS
jgi:ornithine cyclodeaminase